MDSAPVSCLWISMNIDSGRLRPLSPQAGGNNKKISSYQFFRKGRIGINCTPHSFTDFHQFIKTRSSFQVKNEGSKT